MTTTMKQKKDRTFYTTGRVRAQDLETSDYALHDGRWMQVLGVYNDTDDLAGEFGQESLDLNWLRSPAQKIAAAADECILIRFADDRDSAPDDLQDRWVVRVKYDLIEIQVPA